MRLTREAKENIVREVAEQARSATAAIAVDHTGLTVAEATELRRLAREAGVGLRVVRNTLARRALADTDFACMEEELTGPLMLSFSGEEPGSSARLMRDFVKEHGKPEVRILAMNGRLLPLSDLAKLANLPTLEGARATLLGLLQAPYSRLLRTLVEVPSGFARLLAARRDSGAD